MVGIMEFWSTLRNHVARLQEIAADGFSFRAGREVHGMVHAVANIIIPGVSVSSAIPFVGPRRF